MIHNSIKILNKKAIALVSIIALGSCADLKAMKRARENDAVNQISSQEKKQKTEPSVKLGENEFFVYAAEESDKGEESGIKIPLETLMLSKTMSNIQEDFGGSFPEKKIPLNYSKAAITELFNLLQKEINSEDIDKIGQLLLYKEYLRVMKLPLFIEMINLATYLDIPSDKLQLCIDIAADRIDDIKLDKNYPNDDLEKINPDLRDKIISILLKKADKSLGSLLLDKKPSIHRGRSALFNAAGDKITYLATNYPAENEEFVAQLVAHDVMLEKYEEDHVLEQFEELPLSVRRSECSEKIIVETADSQVKIIDLNADEEFFPIPVQDAWHSISKISSSGEWIAILSKGSVNLWRTQHGEEPILLRDKKDPQEDYIACMSFSPCDKYIITGCSRSKEFRMSSDQANIIKWDISDPNNISRNPITGYEDYITAQIKWTLDGKKIIVGFAASQNNLMVLEVKDNNAFIPHMLSRCVDKKGNIGPGHAAAIKSIQLSADSQRLVSSSKELQDNLFIWDLSDLSNIKYAKLNFKNGNYINNIAINPQGNIVLFDYPSQSPCLSYVRDREKMKLLYIESFNFIKKYNIKGSSFDSFSMNKQGNFTMYARDKEMLGIQQGLLLSKEDHKSLSELNTGNLKHAKFIADLYVLRKANERDYKKEQEEFMKARWKRNYIPPTMESIVLPSNSQDKKIFDTLPPRVKGLLKDNWQIEEK